MAREIYLLGLDLWTTTSVRHEATKTWANKLSQLAVGHVAGIQPVLFHPVSQHFIEARNRLQASLGQCAQIEHDPLQDWELPFNGPVQAAASIVGGCAWALLQAQIPRQRHEQPLVLAPSNLTDEFKRLNPYTHLYVDHTYQTPGEQMYTTIIRDISPDKNIGHQ